MARLKPEFDNRGVKIIGLSVDPVDNHKKCSGDIKDVVGFAPNYPMIGDTDLKISKLYGMLPASTAGTSQGRHVRRLLDRGEVQFALVFPSGFSRQLLRGERPTVLLAADATDPSATSNAIAALNQVGTVALTYDLTGPLAGLRAGEPPFTLNIQRRYNPEGITQYNIVPGLLAVILQLTMVMMTAFAVTRERERGTYESLLSTPVLPANIPASGRFFQANNEIQIIQNLSTNQNGGFDIVFTNFPGAPGARTSSFIRC